MSDVSKGPGWWIASDGKWYAPELHPDFLAKARVAAAQASTSSSDVHQTTSASAESDPTVVDWSDAPGALRDTGWPVDPNWGDLPQDPGSQTPAKSAAKVRQRASRRLVISAVLAIVIGVGLVIYFSIGGTSFSRATPTDVANAAVADLQSGNLAGLCDLVAAAAAQQCHVGAALAAALATVTGKDLAVGIVTVQGNKALATVTGTICAGPSGNAQSQQTCHSNHDPNLALDKWPTFDSAFSAVTSSGADTFALPLVKQSGQWYLTGHV